MPEARGRMAMACVCMLLVTHCNQQSTSLGLCSGCFLAVVKRQLTCTGTQLKARPM